MQNLKVVHLINESSLKLGGAQKIVHHMSNSMFETEILDFDCGGETPNYTYIQKLICFSKLLLKIFFKRNEIFFVHHRIFLPFSLLAPNRFIYICHNIFPKRNYFFRYISSVRMVAVSEEVKRYLKSHNSKLSVITIPNGIEVCPGEEKVFLSDGILRVGYVGRLEYQKGIDVLIKAFLKIQQSRDVKLTIVGDGSLSSKLKEMIAEKLNDGSIEFLGYSPRPWALLRGCDYIIVPSRYEGFGLVAYEAISRGHSVILSDLDVFKGLKGKRNVKFIQPGNVQNLKECIDSLENNDPTDKKLRWQASEDIFSVESMIYKYDELVLTEFVKEGFRN